MSRASETIILVNARGLHARASAKFVTLVAEQANGHLIEVEKDGTCVAGSSIMGLMMLGAAKGQEITIHVAGEDADARTRLLAKLAGLVKDGFGED